MFRWRKVVKKDRKVLHRQAMFTIAKRLKRLAWKRSTESLLATG